SKGGRGMNCLDVQQLLAFMHRKGAELDDAERAAIHDHVGQCPDCSAIAQLHQHTDDVLGPLVRDLPAPAGLKERILAKVSAERRVARWRLSKRVGWAAAAAILFVTMTGLIWANWPSPVVT